MSRRRETDPKGGHASDGPRRANDVVGKGARKPEPLFGGLWRRGEIALLFGPPGVGKSLLAVQIADSLGRGRPIDGVQMPKKRSKVLYVDLILSETQFSARYSRDTKRKGRIGRHIFSGNMYRERPKENEDIATWIEKMCVDHSYNVVIFDDLSAVSRSDDGIRETLPLVRELKRLTLKYGLSTMVLADSIETPRSRDAGETDLRRSRVLCSAVDSVFMMQERSGDFRQLSQTRSQTGMLTQSTVECELTAFDSGLTGFAFEKHVGQLSEETVETILRVKEMNDAGMSLRDIEQALHIPKTTVGRRLKQWTPKLRRATAREVTNNMCLDYDEAEGREASRIYGFDTRPQSPGSLVEPDDGTVSRRKSASGYNVSGVPFAAGLGPRSVFDLEIHFDRTGQILYVESEDEYSGKPVRWYTVHQKSGVITRHERRGDVVQQTRLRSKWI
jgi:KaiC/GvpD/RAD55 family RecA-like ATPase